MWGIPMNKSDVNWYGPWVALVTPFTAEGKIDEEAYQRNADLCIQYGCTGLVANGCMGEFWSLSAAERQRILELCVEAAAGRATVIETPRQYRRPKPSGMPRSPSRSAATALWCCRPIS